jgi:aminoglycoside phosphotransferase (APT) family kinase protein
VEVDAALATRLVARQFPQWADLPVAPVSLSGWDNRSFRLGDDLLVRLPSHEAYAAAVEKEQRWLPRLAPQLPLPVPRPVGLGRPDDEYPWPWSVYAWIDGEPAATAPPTDLDSFAVDLARFLVALRGADAEDGPAAGPHSFWRGGPLSTYDEEARRAFAALGDDGRMTAVWDRALASTWDRPPVWCHGDVAVGNLLVRDGRLAAVIDFGSSAVGDPACDTVIAWTLFTGSSRAVFRRTLDLDDDTWDRGRGWALWKAAITLAAGPSPDARHTLAEVLGG